MPRPLSSNTVTITSLIFLAAPTALSAMLNNSYRVIDQYAVQWLGIDAQAAIASTSFLLIGFFAGYSIISSGAIALISRASGAGDNNLQRQLIGNAITGAIIIGVIILTLSGLLAPWTVSLLGLQDNLADTAQSYLRWHALFCLPQALAPTIDAIFIALGRTKTVLLLQLIASSLNILLNPILIYHFDLGIGGAALATGISQAAAMTIGLIIIRRQYCPKPKYFQPDQSLTRIARVGLPMCWGTLLFAGAYWALLNLVISPLGPAVNAALGIGFSVLEGFTWPVFWGFSMAVASLIGRYIGARQMHLADKVIKLSLLLMTGSGLVVTAIFWLGAESLCRLFSNDVEVLNQAILYAHILAFSQLFVAYEALAEGILIGAGATRTILVWSAPLNLLRVPLGWLFAIYFGYGAAGIWWVINISTLIKALGKWRAVQFGDWYREKI